MIELAEFKHQKELERRNKKVIKRYWNGKWNERRPEILDELQTNEVVYHGTSATMNGIEEYKEGYGKYLSESQSSSVEILELLAEGDKVMSRIKLKYTPKGEPGDLASDDNEIIVTVFTVFRLDHKKIAEEWEVIDELGMMQQMGMELHLKEASE